MPIGAFARTAIEIAGQRVELQGGARWWATGPDTAPGWGLRLSVTLLFLT